MKSSRQKEIIQILQQDKLVNTLRLAQQFGVSLETIRRDLNHLEHIGMIRKVYGGAELVDSNENPWPSLSVRQGSNRAAKMAIAEEAIKYVPDSGVIALDAGTTIAELCPLLAGRTDLTIICSDIHSAAVLAQAKSNRVYMMGGFLTGDGTSDGSFSKEFFSGISEITAFICSCDGVDFENGLTSNYLGINELKRRYLKKARTRILLADHSKFSQKGVYKVCSLLDINMLITDRETPVSIIRRMEELGIQVVVTG